MSKQRPLNDFHPTMKRFAELLIDLSLIKKGNEPSQIARLLNESEGVIGNWTGERGISKSGLIKIQKYFAISPAYLTDGVEPKLISKSKDLQKIELDGFTNQELELLNAFRLLDPLTKNEVWGFIKVKLQLEKNDSLSIPVETKDFVKQKIKT